MIDEAALTREPARLGVILEFEDVTASGAK